MGRCGYRGRGHFQRAARCHIRHGQRLCHRAEDRGPRSPAAPTLAQVLHVLPRWQRAAQPRTLQACAWCMRGACMACACG
eukprot:scaffold111331_cov21-Phaeocystis_antarctica.AAC.1